MDILVFSDVYEILPNLISAAKRVQSLTSGGKIYTVFIGDKSKMESEGSIGLGDKAIIVGTDRRLFPEEYAKVLAEIIGKYGMEFVIIGATKKGKEIAPRLAVMLNCGYVTECIGFESDGDGVVLKKMLFGGVVVGDFKFNSQKKICTVIPDYFEALPEESKAAEIIEEEITPPPSRKKLNKVQDIEKEVDLSQAEKIVSVGRGLAKKDDLETIFELAKELGAEVGCSRPISEDFKWMPLERQVGLTGSKVKPKLYLAVGISGQIQHIVGMKDSKVVVAINKDKDAPIFEEADYGVVGDLYKIVPLLISELRKG